MPVAAHDRLDSLAEHFPGLLQLEAHARAIGLQLPQAREQGLHGKRRVADRNPQVAQDG